MRVIIVTEGSARIGFGHINRCLALYQAFAEKGITPEFIVSADRTALNLLKNVNSKNFNWLLKQRLFLKHIKGADILIIDSYLAGKKIYGKISRAVRLPVYLDDNKMINYPRGWVLNGSIQAGREAKTGTYLAGTKYIPLRKEFWDVPEREINKEIKSIMITVGGGDDRKLTLKILTGMNKYLPDLAKNIVVAKGFTAGYIKQIERIKDRRVRIFYFPEALEMKKIMLRSDLAISAGGQTLYELARIGVPTIAIGAAANQAGNIEGWQRAGFIKYAGRGAGPATILNLVEATKLLARKAPRLKMSNIGRSAVDGQGSKRVVSRILKELTIG